MSAKFVYETQCSTPLAARKVKVSPSGHVFTSCYRGPGLELPIYRQLSTVARGTRCATAVEFFRYLAFRTLRKAEEALNVVVLVGSDFDGALVRYHTSFACVSGLGFGTTSAASAMLNLLADVGAGPGTVGFFGDHGSVDLIIYSATAACLALLHTLWSVIASNALLFRRYGVLLFVPAAHLFTAGVTTLTPNAHRDVLYDVMPLAATGVVLYMSATTAFVVSGGTPRNLLSCLGGLLRNPGASINAPEVPPGQL